MNAAISVVNDERVNQRSTDTAYLSEDVATRADKLRQVRVLRHVRVQMYHKVGDRRNWIHRDCRSPAIQWEVGDGGGQGGTHHMNDRFGCIQSETV